jgi:alkylation response protein AidB-like acyl-CoA dehydrogenase
MDFELTEAERMVRDTARSFATAKLSPIAAAIDRDSEIPAGVLRELASLGLMGVNVPESFGGAEAGVVAYASAMMEVARGCASTAVTMAVTNMVAEVIARFGTEAQKARCIPRLTSGETLGAFALSEVDAGSDPGGMRTVARRDGSSWIVRGTKQWISHADKAEVIVLWARTSDEGAKGISCFLVEGKPDGFSIAGHEDKMGLRGSHTCSLALDEVRLPADALFGEEGGGFKIAMMALDGGRIGIASQAIGIAEAAFDAAVQYAKEREQFGRPIADHQAIQWMIADSRKELDAARLLVLRAALLKQRGERFSREASMAKVYATEAAWRVCNRAVQVHGGYGYTREFPVERHLRDVRVTQIYEGTSEIQRVVISRDVLRS